MRTKLTGMGLCNMPMVMFTKESGKKIKLTDRESIHEAMVQSTKVLGLKINSKVRDLKLGQMELNIKVAMKMA